MTFILLLICRHIPFESICLNIVYQCVFVISVYLVHWVNSILTYCKKSIKGFPRILLVATHKDKISQVVQIVNVYFQSSINTIYVSK